MADDRTQSRPGAAIRRPAVERPWGRALQPGLVLADRYLLRRYIASGGMGEVWEAEDLTLREAVALKTIRPDRLSDESRLRLQAEVKLARRIAHPHLCRIFEFGRHEQVDEAPIDFLTMELLEGRLLVDALRESGPLPISEALIILEQLAAGLDAAHAAGIVHRDVKSANIFLESNDGGMRAVIADFGLARDVGAESRITVASAQLGTPAYMSPEQVEGSDVGPASDRFSLAVVAFELVTGEIPWGGATPLSVAMARLTARPRVITTPGVPRHWDAVMAVALAKKPEDRFASAADFVAALKSPSVARRAVRRRAWPAVVALLVMTVVVGASFAWRAFSHRTSTQLLADPCPGGVCAPWSGRLSGSEDQDQTEALLIEPNGSVLIAGRVTGSDDVGCGPFHASGKTTGIIARFSRTGICQWQWIGTQPLVDYVWRLYQGSNGRLFAWGGIHNADDGPYFGPSRVVEIGAGGTVTAVPTQGAPSSWEMMALDRRDRITAAVVTEGFARTADSAKGIDLVHLQPDGQIAWKTHLADGAHIRVMWMEADSRGDVGLVGSFRDTLHLDGESFASHGESDMYIVKASGLDGHVLWKHVFGTAADESQDLGLAVDDDGNWFATGEHGGADFGNGPVTPSIFVVKWSSDGTAIWSRGFGGDSKRDAARRIVIDRDGNALVFGRMLSTQIAFDAREVKNVAGSDLYVVRLAGKTGAVLGVKTWPAVDAPARALAIDRTTGNVAIAGRFNGQLTFGQATFKARGEDGYFASVGVVP